MPEDLQATKYLRAIVRGLVIWRLKSLIDDPSWTEDAAANALSRWDVAELDYLKKLNPKQVGLGVDDVRQSRFGFCREVAVKLVAQKRRAKKPKSRPKRNAALNRSAKKTKSRQKVKKNSGKAPIVPRGLPTPDVGAVKPPMTLEEDYRPKWV